MRTATVTLTDAQVKTLGDGGTDAVIIPSPGANKLIMFLGGHAHLNATVGAYTGVADGSALVFSLGTSLFVSNLMYFPEAQAEHFTFVWSPLILQSGGVPGAGDFAGQIISAPNGGVLQDKDLVLTDWWAGGAYMGGNAANTMVVTVIYSVIDVT